MFYKAMNPASWPYRLCPKGNNESKLSKILKIPLILCPDSWTLDVRSSSLSPLKAIQSCHMSRHFTFTWPYKNN